MRAKAVVPGHIIALTVVGLLAILLASCQGAARLTSGVVPAGIEPLRPGQSLDTMRLETGAQDAVPLWRYCQPSGADFACLVPQLARIGLGYGPWSPAAADLAAPGWSLYINDHPVDLAAFRTYHQSIPVKAAGAGREVVHFGPAWDLVLHWPESGSHTLRFVRPDGSDVLVHFTIVPRASRSAPSVAVRG